MTAIKVRTIFDPIVAVWVRKGVVGRDSQVCICGLHKMCPERAVNFGDEISAQVCRTCGRVVTAHIVADYNRAHGYSGYDEFQGSE